MEIEEDFVSQGTGSHYPDSLNTVITPKEYKTIVYPFGKYQITIKLSLNNEFIGILEVKVNKDFLSYRQNISKGFHDVDEFYRE